MIVNNLKWLMDKHKVTPYQLWQAIGGSKETAYRLYKDESVIPRKDVLEKLLNEYGWEPGDVIKGIPDRESQKQVA